MGWDRLPIISDIQTIFLFYHRSVNGLAHNLHVGPLFVHPNESLKLELSGAWEPLCS